MDKVRRSFLFVIVCLLLAAPAFATTWDAAADFSLTTNPAGAWSYGYSAGVGGALTLFNNLDYGIMAGGGVAWDMSPDANAWSGFVVKNLNDVATTWYGLEIPAGGVAFHPGFTGVEGGLPAPPFLPNVARWTAPVAGDVMINAGFASPLPNIDVYVLVNGVAAFNGQIGADPDYNTQLSTSFVRTVAAGDTVDFVVSLVGDDGRDKFCNFSATITTVPEPSAMLALFTGFAGIGGMALRRRRS